MYQSKISSENWYAITFGEKKVLIYFSNQQMQNEMNQMLANENIVLSDKLMRCQVELEEVSKQNDKLRKAFDDALDLIVEYRERLHYNSVETEDLRYSFLEQGGILD